MMRFSMALLAFHGGFQKMGFKDKAPTHYNLFARLESIEDRCLPSGRLAGTHRSKREAIGSRPHENNVLPVDLLNGIGSNKQCPLKSPDWDYGFGRHLGQDPVLGFTPHDQHYHNADVTVEMA